MSAIYKGENTIKQGSSIIPSEPRTAKESSKTDFQGLNKYHFPMCCWCSETEQGTKMKGWPAGFGLWAAI